MQQLYIQTPLIESPTIAKAAGVGRVYLKLENLQVSSSLSFSVWTEFQTQTRITSSSGGNAGLAAAHAARSLGSGCTATIVVPSTIPLSMIQRIQDADLVREDQTGGVYCPPFDHPDIVDGNATMVNELVEQLAMGGGEKPGAIVCAVGGGGLLSGILHGLREVGSGWEEVPVVAVETDGAASLHASLTAGNLVTIPAITSIATSLGAKRVSQTCFDLATAHVGSVKSVTVTDAEAVDGCVRFVNDQRMLVEPACGTVLSLAYGGRLREVVGEEGSVVLVVCGGSNVSMEMLGRYQERFGASLEN
ncbi:catabolic L-serine/threonine dehydratase [Saitoella coloradoensis]